VRNETQDDQLARFTIDQRLVPLTDNHDHTQLATPRFARRRFRDERLAGGRRDLCSTRRTDSRTDS
jgi:hypothetical protein